MGALVRIQPPAHKQGRLRPPDVQRIKFGRGIDNRALKEQGFAYNFTSAGTVQAFVEAIRLRTTVGQEPGYTYQEDVEQFFRHSPAVVRNRE